METPCVFCEILRGNAQGSFVFRGERVSAFMDVAPFNPGHLLVIPNDHAVGLDDLSPEIGAEMFTIAQRLAKTLKRSEFQCEGINLLLADGRAAFQTVFHVHLHVLPRFFGDDFPIDFEALQRGHADRRVLDDHAKSICKLIQD